MCHYLINCLSYYLNIKSATERHNYITEIAYTRKLELNDISTRNINLSTNIRFIFIQECNIYGI